MDEKEFLAQMTKFEVMLGVLQDRSQSIESQLNTIKDIVRDVQSLALDIRELQTRQNATNADLNELEARVATIEKDLQLASRDKNTLWVNTTLAIVVAVIGAIVGGMLI